MAGNMPSRIEPHAAFGVGKNLHALGIKRIEACIRQHAPMRCLEIVQAIDLLLAIEIARRFGKGLIAMEEIAQTALQRRLDLWPIASQQIAQLRIETGECQSLTQASRL